MNGTSPAPFALGVIPGRSLLKSSIRKTQVLRDGTYAREDAEDDRFDDYFGSLQSIVTSSGQNDSGLFETNLRDERYLPFEGSGVVSEWQLELPADVRQFDYDTISDVILHLRYTAREGGGLLRNGAVENLLTSIEEAQAAGSVRLFSVRHEFPSEWAKFTNVDLDGAGAPDTAELTLELREEHFPYWSKGKLKAIEQVDLYSKKAEDGAKIETHEPKGKIEVTTDETTEDPETSDDLTKTIRLPDPPKMFTLKFTLSFGDNSTEDLWLALTWGGGD